MSMNLSGTKWDLSGSYAEAIACICMWGYSLKWHSDMVVKQAGCQRLAATALASPPV